MGRGTLLETSKITQHRKPKSATQKGPAWPQDHVGGMSDQVCFVSSATRYFPCPQDHRKDSVLLKDPWSHQGIPVFHTRVPRCPFICLINISADHTCPHSGRLNTSLGLPQPPLVSTGDCFQDPLGYQTPWMLRSLRKKQCSICINTTHPPVYFKSSLYILNHLTIPKTM